MFHTELAHFAAHRHVEGVEDDAVDDGAGEDNHDCFDAARVFNRILPVQVSLDLLEQADREVDEDEADDDVAHDDEAPVQLVDGLAQLDAVVGEEDDDCEHDQSVHCELPILVMLFELIRGLALLRVADLPSDERDIEDEKLVGQRRHQECVRREC